MQTLIDFMGRGVENLASRTQMRAPLSLAYWSGGDVRERAAKKTRRERETARPRESGAGWPIKGSDACALRLFRQWTWWELHESVSAHHEFILLLKPRVHRSYYLLSQVKLTRHWLLVFNTRGTIPAQNEAVDFIFCCADVDRCVFEWREPRRWPPGQHHRRLHKESGFIVHQPKYIQVHYIFFKLMTPIIWVIFLIVIATLFQLCFDIGQFFSKCDSYI